ncbi:HlyD family secretion protein [Methyloversatilis sp.]|uniref:HlyD family secretion protein n=1 Tax=Methyloversatilis sp. TaxID=2569862 RepID=UPI002736559E|nr:HlyD family efflux transporter periplasmic adaptor subunit [Methyloversatilis sp.]MDP2867992.1 HlyD family efflux transporter periplasmic adaptor subunit [Methyloversatilis sp.]MDP3454927.1 HlyD family efflux transporter periplasmic adaptor subunit [Methyloversatilis sp.]MDP3577935.1 HlyD family efflux transporter periplasmic adaptor subunit [Methyloversatilis sp.]
MSEPRSRPWLVPIAIALLAIAAFFAWKHFQSPPPIDAFASGNGRIEATEIDVASKTGGRLASVTVREGDDVSAGQTLAGMDVRALEAELHMAEAQVAQAKAAHVAAIAAVAQRRSDVATAGAVVAQRQGQMALAEKDIERTQQLVDKGFISAQKLDVDRTAKQTAQEVARAAVSQMQGAQSSIEVARAAVAQAAAAVEAAQARVERMRVDLQDAVLVAPADGRVLYRLAEPGEVLPAGGKVLTLLDITDVYLTLFLPTSQAGRVAIGSEARIVLDVRPDISIPASVSFVSPQAQFTPKSVETRTEREKLMFRVRVKIPPELLRAYAKQVKTGLPGVAWVRLDANAPWPATVPPPVTLPAQP